MKLLGEKDTYKYYVTDIYFATYLTPIAKNVAEKIQTNWDDYNELSHCCQMLHALKKADETKIDYHIMLDNEGNCVGVIITSYGFINYGYLYKLDIEAQIIKANSLILNYFHIVPEARGNGSQWLQEYVMPYYAQQGYQQIYLKSTHKNAFSMYERLGTAIGSYRKASDNEVFIRDGKIFELPLI